MHWIDPSCVPETRGNVTAFLLNPHGDLDGLVLDEKKQVHFPPHMSDEVMKRVAIGDLIRVRGLKPKLADMIAAISIAPRKGPDIVDGGPDDQAHVHPKPKGKKHAAHRSLFKEAHGTVLMSLYGPKGELRGALLDNGVSLRMPPHAAAELSTYLAPGARVYGWGKGISTPLGQVLEVDEIAERVHEEQ